MADHTRCSCLSHPLPTPHPTPFPLQDLINNMLNCNPEARLTADQVLYDPWVQGAKGALPHLSQFLSFANTPRDDGGVSTARSTSPRGAFDSESKIQDRSSVEALGSPPLCANPVTTSERHSHKSRASLLRLPSLSADDDGTAPLTSHHDHAGAAAGATGGPPLTLHSKAHLDGGGSFGTPTGTSTKLRGGLPLELAPLAATPLSGRGSPTPTAFVAAPPPLPATSPVLP